MLRHYYCRLQAASGEDEHMLFSESTDISRINALTKLTVVTHLILQGNTAFSSFVYSPRLPLDEQWSI